MTAEIQLALVLPLLLTLPGLAVVSVSAAWRDWPLLQRWCLAVGLSIAVYPVGFYLIRSLSAEITLGPLKLAALLILCGTVLIWQLRREWRAWFAFEPLEWLALVIFAATLFTRFWIIRDQPYPAWSDSLHHTLLTQLTAAQGRLPVNMEPYFPIDLGQYHLGLYALTGSAQMLSGAPAHTALLWTAQALNGLCGLGVYLVLDRKVGRWGAVVGAVVVGLWSFQPAWYVNWGRFTQVSSQTILLVTWTVTWETLRALRLSNITWSSTLGQMVVVAAVLNAATFLLHFRVAVFYIPLLLISLVREVEQARRFRQSRQLLTGVTLVGISSIILILPVAVEAVRIHVALSDAPRLASASEVAQTEQGYFTFPLETVVELAARPWLLTLTGIASLVGWLHRSRFAIGMTIWVALVFSLGYTYLLGSPVLNLTNLGAVLIMLYLPIALIIGSAAALILKRLKLDLSFPAMLTLTAALAVSGFITGRARATEIEPYRYFVSPADLQAMDWIRTHTPPDSVFAVSTHFWLPTFPHGMDAGYWIPYLTERRTTAGCMLFVFAPENYINWLLEVSRQVEKLNRADASTVINQLRSLGVDYIYVGARSGFVDPELMVDRLRGLPNVTVVYDQDEVRVLELAP